jgi:phospholipase D1/2
MLSISSILKTSFLVCLPLTFFFSFSRLTLLVTATGDQQRPIFNTIGRAIVDACVHAGKEGRKFRVIIVISAIPGFAGDLRDSVAAGTRAIMDYQYKSICRGEHSIMGQIKKAGVDPTRKGCHLSFIGNWCN